MVGLTVEEAIACMLGHATAITEIETLPILEAGGRICAQDMLAPFDNPPFDRSPLDGYAVRAEDIHGASQQNPVTLKVVGEVCAGDCFDKTVQPGQAVRIMTGAAFPAGTNCTVKQESTDYGEDTVAIYQEVKPFENYCYRGEDYKKDSCLVPKGTRITYIEQGLLASMGCSHVPVWKKPRVALLTTGDEAVAPGEPLANGKIYDSNLFLLGARLTELGFAPVYTAHVRDDAGHVAEQIQKAATLADIIITTGGVSVGKKDILHEAIPLLGIERIFWKVKLKPGTPTIFAMYEGKPLVCLSGNPFGAITNVELLVRPLLAKMGHDAALPARQIRAIMNDPFPKASKQRRYIRARYEDGRVMLPQGLHSSGVIASMRGCNCLIDIPAGNEGIKAGEEVAVVLL